MIIPVWQQETELERLRSDLANTGAEIIPVSAGSRAKSLNQGATQASHDILWFVHADTRIKPDNIQALHRSLQHSPNALHYFKLQFAETGLSALNAYLANVRSAWFGLPYGDQALCLTKQQFKLTGGYPEDTSYGEDLLFVRKAKQLNIALCCTQSTIISSARKYNTQGWLKTTLSHWAIMLELLRKKI